MANNVGEWSATAASNTSLGAVSLQENIMLVNAVNNAFREAMAQVAAARADGTLANLIDEDSFATDSATRPPSQQSVKAYVDANASYPSGHLWGLTLSNGTDATNDINVAAGTCRSSDDTTNINISAAMGKQADAVWAAGGTTATPLGGRFHTTLADGTLHFYAIKNPSTGVSDSGFSDNASDPTGGANYPAGFTKYRRIGSLVRASGAIRAFKQSGDEFIWDVAISDVNAAAPNTSGTTVTLSVPTGIAVDAKCVFAFQYSSVTAYILFTQLNQTNTTPSNTIFDLFISSNGQYSFLGKLIKTDTSAGIRQRATSTSAFYYVETHGYIDTRGRLN